MSKNETKAETKAETKDAKAPESKAPEPELSPIDKLRNQRSEIEASISECNEEIAEAAGRGDTDDVISASNSLRDLQRSLDTVMSSLRSAALAANVEALLRAAIGGTQKELINAAKTFADEQPQAETQVGCAWRTGEDGETVVFNGCSSVSVSSGTKGGKRKAALRSATRPARLPPEGTILRASSVNSNWSPDNENDVEVTFTAGKAVIVNGETYVSAGKAGETILGHKSCNPYRWLGLGKPSHVWDGEQHAWSE